LAVFSYLPAVAREYLDSRGISSSSIAQWELGWNPETKRITIPVRDQQGRLRFVIERAVFPNQFPKYLYPKESHKSDLLFGACFLNPGMIRWSGIVLVEGSLDVIRLHQHDISSAVGILGSKLSKRQAEIISRMRPMHITTMFDKDTSGVGATISVKQRLSRVPMIVCRYPKGKNDPAELTKEEATRAISRAVPFSVFMHTARSPKEATVGISTES
jgi:DNA primase